jgi:hypothetical protein
VPRKKLPPHPMQPVQRDPDGVVRFRSNKIVRFLLDAGPYDLNKLAMMPFDEDDREQLAQLIGYSVSGYAELPYVSNESYRQASEAKKELLNRKGK